MSMIDQKEGKNPAVNFYFQNDESVNKVKRKKYIYIYF